MAVELQSGLPSVHQFQSLIREKQQIEIKLVTNDVITGTLRWQDPQCFCVDSNEGQTLVLWQQTVAYLKLL
ncbi:MAG: RNA-binding protein hfq [Leptolyngbyaceae cyanobacterium SM1_1_3]|nr:RNA-binding protein hfq [Leptolyngbyaceae cyanobacterium SM1_1_3]NJN01406.1 RNA-binding protein hfq [Leptolyngbyaceae cyanobacterium RM1_1_2]NJO09581.1 RNA-binding protein hfq [Leptolyngbyaceae cyanobacterium SL_1_1]